MSDERVADYLSVGNGFISGVLCLSNAGLKAVACFFGIEHAGWYGICHEGSSFTSSAHGPEHSVFRSDS
jgi:hypothetical protein